MDEDQATWDNPDQASLSSTGVVRTTMRTIGSLHIARLYVTCMERLFFCFDPVHELVISAPI